VPKKLLPFEYGGEAGTIDDNIKIWEEKLLANRDFFKEQEQYGVDESKRKIKLKSYQEIFGTEGSFRTLDFD
jgi:hypothetical protein